MESLTAAEYAVYTTEFDSELHILDLVHESELASLRDRLTARFTSRDSDVQGFKTYLLDLKDTLSQEMERHGVDPSETGITFLVDLSGSTRGSLSQHITMSTIELCLALEALGVDTAVLGYTTAALKDGEARQKWLADGKPRDPGRLSELRHIFFKMPEEEMSDVVTTLFGLHVDRIKRENVDGEAIEWAVSIAKEWDRPNRIVVNVTDDVSPMDDTTTNNNRTDILLKHMLDVCDAVDEEGEISLSRAYIYSTLDQHRQWEERRNIGERSFTRESFISRSNDPEDTLRTIVDSVGLGFERAAQIAEMKNENRSTR